MSVGVSFVIPTYRSTDTLSRSLGSLIAQSDRDWEATIVDDGSDDATVDMVRAWCARDPRLTLIEAEHGGPARARNIGLKATSGEWVVFLDADDTIHPHFLRRMRHIAARRPEVDIVACGYTRLDANGRVSASIPPLPLDIDPVVVCSAGPPGAIHSFMVRRGRVMEAGGFDETLTTSEDWDLWLRIALAGARFAVTPRLLAFYWSTPNSLTRRGERMLEDSRIVMERARALELNRVPGLEMFDHRAHSLDDLALRRAFWSAGVSIGGGGSASSLVPSIPPAASPDRQVTHLIEKFIDGLVVGSSVPHGELILHWFKMRPGSEAFIDAVVAHAKGAGNRAALLTLAEVMIARHGYFRRSIRLGNVEALMLTPRLLLKGYRPDPGVEVVIVRLPWLRPATFFSYLVAVFGPLTPGDLWRSILRGTHRRIALRARETPHLAALLDHAHRAMAVARRSVGATRRRSPALPPTAALTEQAEAIQARLSDAIARDVQVLVAPTAESEGAHPGTGSSASEWDRFFEAEDPWNYGSPYEQLKYQRTLDLIRPNPTARALELACAEGRFTELLAPNVATLVAADISQTAIERARRRVAAFDNVEFQQLELFKDRIPSGFDLITCSEVLYFSPSREQLDKLAGEIAQALNPGGYFAHAHAYELVDSPDRTAFDWNDTIGAAGVHAAFASEPRLVFERGIETELYRIDLFRRVEPGEPRSAPNITELPIGAPIDAEVAANIVWNGAVRIRADVAAARAYTVPILRIEELAGPALERVLRFLRRRGFASVTPDELAAGAERAGSLRGRPVMLIADDPGGDWLAQNWDLIRGSGFGLHLFVRPGAGSSDSMLAAAIAQGLTIGSGLMSTTPADDLDNGTLLEDAIRSRLILERKTGGPVTTVSPPLGRSDARVEQILSAAGYRRLFRDDYGLAPVCGLEMLTATIRVTPATTMEALAAELPAYTEGPDATELD